MLTLYDAISTLLLQYDQVAVPGLGTFRCQYQSASVNVITNQFEKPSCALAFNAEVDPDDRRLVDYLSAQRGVTESQAREALERFVTDLQERLKEEGSVAFPGLGSLSLDAQGNPNRIKRALATASASPTLTLNLSSLAPRLTTGEPWWPVRSRISTHP